jgi:enterochelin esterase-like enzyme
MIKINAMRKVLSIALLVTTQWYAFGQNSNYKYLHDVITSLKSGKSEEVETQFNKLRTAFKIPLIIEDSVYFLYRGEAKTVEWMGDFNGWGYKKEFNNKGKKIPGTNIWYLNASFPLDARLDYKILIDGNGWILDPENDYQQWSGVGGGSPNSELRMPQWQEDPITIERAESNKGTLTKDQLLYANALGYQVTYSVYQPFDVEKLGNLPTIYVTDGYEYLHPQLGRMSTILDNLISDKKIKPIIAVFVDNREPINRANNRRMNELAMNSKYLDFFMDDLIPKIESTYPVMANAQSRAILGASMGGLTSTYFAFAKPEVFGLAGIQSPAFYTRPQIYSLCSDTANPKMKISMSAGVINDTSADSRKMKDLLEASSCEYHYREVNEGHSWGNWRRLIDDILIDFFPMQP